jgi:hypothetical protein
VHGPRQSRHRHEFRQACHPGRIRRERRAVHSQVSMFSVFTHLFAYSPRVRLASVCTELVGVLARVAAAIPPTSTTTGPWSCSNASETARTMASKGKQRLRMATKVPENWSLRKRQTKFLSWTIEVAAAADRSRQWFERPTPRRWRRPSVGGAAFGGTPSAWRSCDRSRANNPSPLTKNNTRKEQEG